MFADFCNLQIKYDFVPALIRLLDLAFKEWGWPGSALRAQSR